MTISEGSSLSGRSSWFGEGHCTAGRSRPAPGLTANWEGWWLGKFRDSGRWPPWSIVCLPHVNGAATVVARHPSTYREEPNHLSSRLFVQDTLASGKQLTLGDERSHYIGRVLRLKAGDALTLFDGRGGEFAATVSEVSRKGVVVTTGEKSSRERESPLSIHLVQAISRGERMDFVVQKATELGVVRVTPVMSEFSVVKLDGSKRAKRARHWRRIAESACEQSGRNRVPEIGAPCTFDEWLQSLTADEARLRLVLQPSASAALAGIEATPAAIDLLIGPEGGLSEQEVERALAAGFMAVGFGPRILRTETAAVAAVAALQARWGDLA